MPMHPLPILINHGVPVALSSDDPSLFQNMGLSFDFFQVCSVSCVSFIVTQICATTGICSKRRHWSAHAGAYRTRQYPGTHFSISLPLQAMIGCVRSQYSMLTTDEKARATLKWEERWERFVDEIVESDGARRN